MHNKIHKDGWVTHTVKKMVDGKVHVIVYDHTETVVSHEVKDHDEDMARAVAFVHAKDKPKTDCTHRPKEKVRLEQCTSCGGKVMAPIFKCPIHGECTNLKGKKPFANIKYCGDCPDRIQP